MSLALPEIRHSESADGVRLAYRLRAGTAPSLVFLPGYASDMDGAKALALCAFAEVRCLGMLRFDYSGTGLSGGRFEDGTLGRWLGEAVAMVDRLIEGPVIVIGSSMGAWIALHLALRLPDRVAALVGIAAAPDFTEWGYTADQKEQLLRDGKIERADRPGGEPLITTRGFWQSGQALRLLDGAIDIRCPVRLLHGEIDAEVPVSIAMKLMQQLRSADVQLNIIKSGGHRLSEPHEIDAIVRTVAALLEQMP